MVNKRKRADIFFDSIDFEIIDLLSRFGYKGLGVLEIAKKLNISHKSLKPHIDKLMYLRIIYSSKNREGKISLYLQLNTKDIFLEQDFPDPQSYRGAMRELEKQQILINYLSEVQNFFINLEHKKLIEQDLRRKKDIPLGINYQKELKRLKENEKIANEVIKEREELK